MLEEIVRPSYLWYPERKGSHLDAVREVAELIGRPLDPEQEIAVDAKTSYGAGGRWLTLETGLKIPRQNGKTAGIETPIVLYELFTGEPDRIAWTAHLFRTTRDAFRDHVNLIQSCPDFDREVRKITYANGEESIELLSGARLEYLARSKGGGRGIGGKRVVVDEALFFTSEQAGALLPILAARENPQIDYLSSAAKVDSDQLRSLTRRGRAGNDPSLIWVEWCAPGSFAHPGCMDTRCKHALETPGCVLDDPKMLTLSNPALRAGRIKLSFLEGMRRTMDPIEYAREFFGWDEEADFSTVVTIPIDAWVSRIDMESRMTGSRSIALDIAPDRGSASVSGAGYRDDGSIHLSLIEHRSGTTWVVPKVLELVRKHNPVSVVIDQASQAASEIEALVSSGLQRRTSENPAGKLVITTAGDMARACSSLFDAIAGDAPTAWHRGDPRLQAALAGAARRDVGDGGWAFRRKSSEVDICPIVSVAEALFGLVTVPVDVSPMIAWR